jgi:glycosyltransferase involved in cell wall biosynthesis
MDARVGSTRQSERVSVVIATNRDTPFLADALASVVAQTYQDWEIVVVDNGVPDPAALRATVEHVGGARTIVVPPAATVSLARNAGVSASTGGLVVFLDDDDIWHPERLEAQVASLRSQPSAPASYCGGWHLDGAGVAFPPSWPVLTASAEEMLAGRRRMPHICGAMLIRRSDFEHVGGFSPELSMMEDFELALRLLGRGSFACVERELVGYRRHDHNVTNTDPANARVRRDAIDGILRRHRWAAGVRGDWLTESLLGEHLALESRRASREAARATLHELRRGRIRGARSEMAWGLRHDAGAFATAITDKVLRREELHTDGSL